MTSRWLSIALCGTVATSLGACASAQGPGASPAGAGYSAPVEPVAAAAPFAKGDDDVATYSRNDAVAPPGERGAWQFSFDTYIWLLDMDGNVKSNGHTVPVSSHLADSIDLITDHFDLALAGHLEARNGAWAIFLDVNYASFEGEGSASRDVLNGVGVASAEMSTDLEQIMTEVGAAWRVTEFALGEKRKAPLELLGGVRWNHLAVDTDLETTVTTAQQTFDRDFQANFSTEWFDPFIGARTLVPFTDQLGLLVRADIGGGFGSGSDFAWNVITGFIYKFSDCVETFAGYRWYSFDRTISGRDTNMQFEGPGAGITFWF
jgi:hypothetical protein